MSLQPAYDAAWLLLAGKVRLEADSYEYEFGSGDCVLLGPSPRVQSLSPQVRMVSVNFVWADREGRAMLDSEAPIFLSSGSVNEPVAEVIKNFAGLITGLCGNPAQLQPMARFDLETYHRIQSAFHAWLAEIIPAMRRAGKPPGNRAAIDFRVAALRDQLNIIPLDATPDYEVLSLACGISRPQVERLYRAEFGVSPHAYFQRRRIAHACRLLSGTDDPIKSIALDLGFLNLSAFSTWFSSREHHAPSRYRALARGGASE